MIDCKRGENLSGGCIQVFEILADGDVLEGKAGREEAEYVGKAAERLNLQVTEKSKASMAESGFSCTDCKIP